jgi:two-component system phosphate regulon sensor histidine kinase PhoR
MDSSEYSPPENDEISREWLANPLLRALLDVVREAVLIVDRDMRVVFANRAARELFVFPPQEWPRLIDIMRNREIYSCFSQALREIELFERHIVLHSGSGERSLDLRIESISSSHQDQIIGAVGAFFDKTRLEALEKVRREFFANLSHELRTPLTSIQSYTETLLSGGLQDKENNVKFVEIIAKHAARMQSLAQDISDLASIEAGKVVMRPTMVALARVAHEVTELLKDSLTAKQIRCEIAIDENFHVYADPKGLEQILFNLVQNGARFNREGGSITISARNEDSHHIITVRDSGIGIEAKHIPRIFERLYRVDESRSRKEGGTGLGLAIVKHLAQTHGGAITVESVPNQGSVFSLILPMENCSPLKAIEEEERGQGSGIKGQGRLKSEE